MSDTMQLNAGRIQQVGITVDRVGPLAMTVVISEYHILIGGSDEAELEPMKVRQFGRMLAGADLADEGNGLTDITDLSDEEYLARLLG